jgi:hypothetical protein
MEMVDARLAAGETDGWRYADLPEDGQAWRDTLGYLDMDAQARCGTGFADAKERDQAAIIQAVQDSREWHGMPAPRVWSLWTRYACTALYSHPYAWSEMGFPGPAYPRGYKNAGVGKLEPFEVRDARPAEEPGPITGCGGTCAGSPIRTRSTWSSSAAALAARSWRSGSRGRAGEWRRSTRGRSGTPTPTG